METYEWLILAILIGVLIGFPPLYMWITAKNRWEITLRDNTSFIGKRTWKAILREGLFERAYQVVDSQNSPFKENMIVVLGLGSILYRVRLQKEMT